MKVKNDIAAQAGSENYRIYWNNVCLLSKMEEEFINTDTYQWEERTRCSFKVEYFGLAKGRKLSEKIREELSGGTTNADIIISTDLDIFQDDGLISGYKEELQDLTDYFNVRKELLDSQIPYLDGRLMPFIVIPLVMVVNKNLIAPQDVPLSLKQLLDDKYKGKVLFGGMGNSAGRSVIKSFWYLFGEEGLQRFIENARATMLPVIAFNEVMKGEAPIAIVPSIFAMRKDMNGLAGIWPEEGAIAIPSYLAVKNRVPSEYISMMSSSLFGVEKHNFYSERGNIVPVHPDAILPVWAEENECRFVYPPWEWMNMMDMKKFENYCESVQKY